MANPLTKEEVEKAKQKQRGVITDCDKAIADGQDNIATLNTVIAQQTGAKSLAQDTLRALDDDFPMAEGLTTAKGNPGATSIVDSSLIDSSLPLVGKTLKIRPATLEEDSADIIEFKADTGEAVVSKQLKGGQVPSNVSYKILDVIPNEV